MKCLKALHEASFYVAGILWACCGVEDLFVAFRTWAGAIVGNVNSGDEIECCLNTGSSPREEGRGMRLGRNLGCDRLQR